MHENPCLVGTPMKIALVGLFNLFTAFLVSEGGLEDESFVNGVLHVH